jgi:hypothetical protein
VTAAQMRRMSQFTDAANFTLRCRSSAGACGCGWSRLLLLLLLLLLLWR